MRDEIGDKRVAMTNDAVFSVLGEHGCKTWDRFWKINSIKNKCCQKHVMKRCKWNLFVLEGFVLRDEIGDKRVAMTNDAVFSVLGQHGHKTWDRFWENQLNKEQMLPNTMSCHVTL